MTVYLIDIECRKGEGGTLGPYKTKARALKALRDYVEDHYTPNGIKHCIDEFDSDLDKGVFYSEEETLELISRELEE